MNRFTWLNGRLELSINNDILHYNILKLDNSKEEVLKFLLKDIRCIKLIQPKQYWGWNILIGLFSIVAHGGDVFFTEEYKLKITFNRQLFKRPKFLTLSNLSKSEVVSLDKFLKSNHFLPS